MSETVMYSVTPAGKWGKEVPVTAELMSYNARYARMRVTDAAGKAFIVNMPLDLCALMASKITGFAAVRRGMGRA